MLFHPYICWAYFFKNEKHFLSNYSVIITLNNNSLILYATWPIIEIPEVSQNVFASGLNWVHNKIYILTASF